MLRNEMVRACYSFDSTLLFHFIMLSNVLGKHLSKVDFRHTVSFEYLFCERFL